MSNNGLPEMYELDTALAKFLKDQGEFGENILKEVELPAPDCSDQPITPERLKIRTSQIVEALRSARAPKLTRTPQSLDSPEVNLALQGMIDRLSLGARERVLEVLTAGVDMEELERRAEYATRELRSEHWPEFRFGPANGHAVRRDELAVRSAMVQNMMWDSAMGNVLRNYMKLLEEGRV